MGKIEALVFAVFTVICMFLITQKPTMENSDVIPYPVCQNTTVYVLNITERTIPAECQICPECIIPKPCEICDCPYCEDCKKTYHLDKILDLRPDKELREPLASGWALCKKQVINLMDLPGVAHQHIYKLPEIIDHRVCNLTADYIWFVKLENYTSDTLNSTQPYFTVQKNKYLEIIESDKIVFIEK
jgi:hypothetical protein